VLSVVIIAKNEAHNLPRCLQSLKGLADEVVVVDSGSTDGTLEVCAQHGATVHQRDFTTYADQKNWAADQASHPYVFEFRTRIESVSADLFKELRRGKTSCGPHRRTSPRRWSLPRLTSYLGTCGPSRGMVPRRKSGCGVRCTGSWTPAQPGGMLHEAWVPNVPSRVAKLEGDLHHHSLPSFSDHLRQLAKFSTLGAADAKLQGSQATF
jgi:glycosyltransferase involved in cell wall biosynthesis